jgi:4'-phosphopantetheinyl transferase
VTSDRLDVGGHLGTARTTRGDAELWYTWVGDHAAEVDQLSRDLLSSPERTRVKRYRSREAAERYVVTRSLVRVVLARQLGGQPRDIEVSRTDSGKPVVTGGVHFNVSHSGDLILMAISGDCDVGVDVERRREIERVGQLTQRWLTAEERNEVDRLVASGLNESSAFLRIWTLKEARLKAIGIGISGAAMSLADMEAVPLDELLGRLGEHAGTSYVGAIAFASAR